MQQQPWHRLLCCAAAVAIVATLLHGCTDDSECESFTQKSCQEYTTESDCNKSRACQDDCFWAGCSNGAGSCMAGFPHELCKCSFFVNGTVCYLGNMDPTDSYTHTLGFLGGSCPADADGCNCTTCTERDPWIVDGRLLSTGSGAATAKILPGGSPKDGGDGSGGCDWSWWPAEHSLSQRGAEGAALDAELVQEVVGHYQHAGLSEHASVASFSRAVLELMTHGAPAGLVDRTLAAAREEVQHAQMALTLARELSGEPFRVSGVDGNLPSEAGGLGNVGLAGLARRAVLEACAGETPAVLRAALGLAVAREGRVRKYLEVVVREERRHAELAWATVAWSLSAEVGISGNPPQQEPPREAWIAASEALASAKTTLWNQAQRWPVHTDPTAPSDASRRDRLLQYGVLPPDLQAAMARLAASLVERLAAKLLKEAPAGKLSLFEDYVKRSFDEALEEAAKLVPGPPETIATV